jgi:hypothetical protein
MADLDLTKTSVSDYSNLEVYSIPPQAVDSPSGQNETEWTNAKWTTYWGWFNQNPKVKNAILMKAMWNVGKGWEADTLTKSILEMIRGWGKDTFKNILFNLEVTRRIGGDAYAEIITHNGKTLKEGGKLVNLKPLNPGMMKHIINEKGIIIRYEKVDSSGKKTEIKFKPEEIFHICNNRIADQTHGISDLEVLEKVILADSKSFEDMKKVCEFQAKPFILWKFKTDDEAKINAVMTKIRTIREITGDLAVPDDEGVLSWEVIQVQPSSILMEWRTDIRNEFYRAIGLPQIIPGAGGQGTESESKVILYAFENIVQSDQLDWEDALLSQLGVKVNLLHPSLMEDLLGQDNLKDGANAFKVQKGEMTPGQDKG